MKNRTSKLIAGALLLGAATAAGAQSLSRAQTFAAQFAQMQALSDNSSSYAFHPPSAPRTRPDDPVGQESFADRFAQMQAESSNSSEFKPAATLTAQAADPVGHESFADRFAQMQAESSNSGEFKALAGGQETAYASASGATDAAKPSLTQRVARLLHRGTTTPSQSN